jgi:hypothetical protein
VVTQLDERLDQHIRVQQHKLAAQLRGRPPAMSLQLQEGLQQLRVRDLIITGLL